ncbi:MAG: hypothetical protein K2P33_10955, partial [Acutalibacter sp.]|nr:hypothetical protein [Acutalibacter sp.]
QVPCKHPHSYPLVFMLAFLQQSSFCKLKDSFCHHIQLLHLNVVSTAWGYIKPKQIFSVPGINPSMDHGNFILVPADLTAIARKFVPPWQTIRSALKLTLEHPVLRKLFAGRKPELPKPAYRYIIFYSKSHFDFLLFMQTAAGQSPG